MHASTSKCSLYGGIVARLRDRLNWNEGKGRETQTLVPRGFRKSTPGEILLSPLMTRNYRLASVKMIATETLFGAIDRSRRGRPLYVRFGESRAIHEFTGNCSLHERATSISQKLPSRRSSLIQWLTLRDTLACLTSIGKRRGASTIPLSPLFLSFVYPFRID